MLSPLLFFKWFGPLNKEGKYTRHSMSAFPVLWAVTSADSYSSTQNKYQTLYVGSSCIPTTSKLTDTKE